VANTYATASWVARKSLSLLHSKAQAAMACNRNYESAIGAKIDGVPIGTSYTVRVPFNFTLRTGASMAAQNLVQRTAVLTINQQNGVDVNLSSIERQFNIGDFEEQIIRPASARIASGINNNVTALTNQFPKSVGNLGSAAATITFLNVQQANQFLTQALAPEGEDVRTLLTSPVHETDWISSNSSLYNPNIDISDQWREGMIASRVLGFAAVREPKMPGYTTGVYGSSTPVISAGTTVGSTGVGNTYTATTTMPTTGWASGGTTLNAGDVFCVVGTNEVDPETKISVGRLKQFVVVTQISDSSGAISPVISPCPISGGAYQNVDVLPVAGKGLTVANGGSAISAASGGGITQSQSLALHKDAILFACVPLIDASELVKFYAQEQFDGFAVRVIQTYDTNNDLMPLRLDTISGEVVSYPELGVRVVGT
jgi:hypothetical protein